MPTIHVAGYPHTVGGAGPHLWGLIRAWRSVGIEVVLLSKENRDTTWYPRLKALGCRFKHTKRQWDAVGAGDIVGAWCSKKFCRHAHEFHKRGCTLIWNGCMTYLMSEEQVVHGSFRFDRVILNSAYQDARLRKQLLTYGYPPERLIRIPTAFWPDEWQFQPKPRTGPFVVGRLSRAATDKYDSHLWALYGKLRERLAGQMTARVMAWGPKVAEHCGAPPDWAECMKSGQESAEVFLHGLHAMIHRSGGARENRPRVCMEAMACGVPVLAENRAGWLELIEHGRTGYLCDTDEDFIGYATELSLSETKRLTICNQARESLPKIADNAAIGEAWRHLLEEIHSGQAEAA